MADHRRDNRALRAAQFVIDDPSWSLHPGFQHPRDQTQERLIGNPLSQHGEDLHMRHRIEKLSQIKIGDPVDRRTHDLVIELS